MLLLALFLVFLNGFFVMSEFALVKVRRTRLEELISEGNRKAKLAQHVTGHLDAYLSATQLGITLASLGLGWIGEPAIASLLTPFIETQLGLSTVVTHTISGIIAFVIITFLHIVFGELAPKSVAIQRPEWAALNTSGPMHAFYMIFYPLIWSLNGVANSFLRLIGLPPTDQLDRAHSEEELRMLVSVSQQHGVLDEMEGTLIDNVFAFADRVAREIMVPRQDMVCLYVDDTPEEILKVVEKYGHTRYPLCEEDRDHVIGLVHVREIMPLVSDQKLDDDWDLRKVMREILIVPEGMPIAKVLQEMRRHRTHIVLVADEYGGTAGLVTSEDILEELVGELYDEFDSGIPEVRRLTQDIYDVDGQVLLEDLQEDLDLDMDEVEDVDTIGGYVFQCLGRRPKVGDAVEAGGFRMTVAEINRLRITRLRLERITSG